jgi:hypothetical protein
MYDLKFAKESLFLRIYNFSVLYTSNMLSYWLFISVYHLNIFLWNLNWRDSTLRHTISFHNLMLQSFRKHIPKSTDTKTISFTSYHWTVLPMYEMEGSTFIGNWIWLNVAFNSINLILQDIHTLNEFKNKINRSST